MESIKFIGISVCITMVITSIFSMLTPDTRLDKIIKFAISLFFLTGLISPFVSGNLNFNIDIEDVSYNQDETQLSKSIENQFTNVAKSNIENTLEKILNNNNIFTKKIEVFINITENQSISISKTMVYIDKKKMYDKKQIEEITKEQIGIIPVIVEN